MKRFLLAISVVFLLSLGLAGVALADNGPHGNYTDLTDKCAACHRAHTGLGASLLTSAASPNDKSAFCYTCHSGGLGAYTDVKNGIFVNVNPAPPDENTSVSPNTSLRGGGFAQVQMNPGLTGTLTLPVTSRHEITGGDNIVWGYGDVTSPTVSLGAASVALTCTNCHNPHGGAGSGNSATYRILKGNNSNNTELFANGTVTPTASVDVPDESGPKYYYTGSSNYFGQHGAMVGSENVYAALTSWCAQCHTRYMQPLTSGPGHTESGDVVYKYRHGTNEPSSSGCAACHSSQYFMPPEPACLSCHVAHGTGARMATYSGGVPWPGGATSPNGDSRSSLLRLDNRGICQQCHNM